MDEEKLTAGQAAGIIEGIEEWWQERRNAYAMSTEEHNREAAEVDRLKDKIRNMTAGDDAEGTDH